MKNIILMDWQEYNSIVKDRESFLLLADLNDFVDFITFNDVTDDYDRYYDTYHKYICCVHEIARRLNYGK